MQKWRFWGKITPLRENFHNSSIKVQYSTPIDVFFPNFMPPGSVTKNASSLYPLQKKTRTFFAAILSPFGPKRPNFNT